MGPCYFLAQNPETQAQNASAKVQRFHFAKGPSGSIMQGIEITSSKSIFTLIAGYGVYGDGSISADNTSISIIKLQDKLQAAT
ncbi:MAG: hypothetical protein ABIX01_00200 [Chitinophagaceae bacterium]